MIRPDRDRGQPGGFPAQFRGSLSRQCPECGARIGKKCVVWRVQDGERLYPIHPRKKPHPERVHQT